jgi:hypothetical protein
VHLLDEVESLRGIHERFLSLVAVLNAGFGRGAVVTSTEKRGERFVEASYGVSAPRVLAGVAGLREMLEKGLWLLERQGIDDRPVDLWSPLIALDGVADGEDGGDRTRDLLDAARELATARAAGDGAGFTARLVEELEGVRATPGERLKTTKRLAVSGPDPARDHPAAGAGRGAGGTGAMSTTTGWPTSRPGTAGGPTAGRARPGPSIPRPGLRKW